MKFRTLSLLAGLLLPLFLGSCNSLLTAGPIPPENERRANLIARELEKYGYIESKEYVAAQPAGTPVALHNRALPARNGTVTFNTPALPRGKYRVFANSGGFHHSDGHRLEDRTWMVEEWDGSLGVAATAAVLVVPNVLEGDRAAQPPSENIIHAMYYHNTVAGGAGGSFGHDLIVPIRSELHYGTFDPSVYSILNVECRIKGKPFQWLRVWAEPIRPGNRGPAPGPQFPPPPLVTR